MKLAERLSRIQASQTLAVAARSKDLISQGIDMVGLGAGEPDFDTPDNVKRVAKEAIDDGFTKYTKVCGIDELREAVCTKLKRDNNLDYTADQVLISCGGKQSLYNAFMAALSVGDEVIILSPYWVSFPEQVKMADATPVFLDLDPKAGFRRSVQPIESVITDKTAMVILNSPSNPTGSILDEDYVAEVVEAAVKHDLLIISDETYEQIVFEGTYRSTASYEGAYERTLTINSLSKTYAMTGWRVGYAAGPEALIKGMTKVQSQSTSNPNSIAQKAAVEALIGDQTIVSTRCDKFNDRMEKVFARLNELEGVTCPKPDGAFYLFPDVSSYYGKSYNGKTIGSSIDFSEFLIDVARVAVVPGIAFGSDASIRISYATSMEQLNKALDRIGEALKELN